MADAALMVSGGRRRRAGAPLDEVWSNDGPVQELDTRKKTRLLQGKGVLLQNAEPHADMRASNPDTPLVRPRARHAGPRLREPSTGTAAPAPCNLPPLTTALCAEHPWWTSSLDENDAPDEEDDELRALDSMAVRPESPAAGRSLHLLSW
jgi:hypothetical protein